MSFEADILLHKNDISQIFFYRIRMSLKNTSSSAFQKSTKL